MPTFRAYRIHRNDGRISARFDQITLDDLTPGEVAVRVRYSDINYKDALAATGTAPILRKYPLVGGTGHPPHGAERPDTGHGADPRERRDLRPRQLERISARVVKFDTLPAQFFPYIDGAITGRIVVEIS